MSNSKNHLLPTSASEKSFCKGNYPNGGGMEGKPAIARVPSVERDVDMERAVMDRLAGSFSLNSVNANNNNSMKNSSSSSSIKNSNSSNSLKNSSSSNSLKNSSQQAVQPNEGISTEQEDVWVRREDVQTAKEEIPPKKMETQSTKVEIVNKKEETAAPIISAINEEADKGIEADKAAKDNYVAPWKKVGVSFSTKSYA